MRKLIVAFSFIAALVALGLSTQHAEAQCTHLGNVGACPVGVSNGATSQQFTNGGILWDTGQFSTSNQCCPADGGLGTATGLFDNNFGGPGAGPGAAFGGSPTPAPFSTENAPGALPFVPADGLTAAQETQVRQDTDRVLTQSISQLGDDPEFDTQINQIARDLISEDFGKLRAIEDEEDFGASERRDLSTSSSMGEANQRRGAAGIGSVMDDVESFFVRL